jgi:hypothetical protein
MRKTLIAIAGLALAAAPISAAHAVSDHTVEVQVSTTQIDLGKPISISGHVSGVSSKGFTVDIHADYSSGNSGGPIHIGHADVHSSGNFSKTYTPPKGGAYTFNVKVEDNEGHQVAEGNSPRLLVMRWTALKNLNPSTGDQPVGSAGTTTGKTVDGVKWDHELYLRDKHYLAFYLGLPCTSLKSYIGISDSAPSGTTADFELDQHDTPTYTRHLTRGVKGHFTRAINPVTEYINISAVFAAGTDSVSKKIILGEPKAYCAIG